MKRFQNIFCLLSLWVIPISASNETLVKVQQGWLSGESLQAVTGDMVYYSFKGIPYAEPPNGTLRFKAPRAPLTWDGVRNATEHGSVCPQVNIFNYSELTPGSEDCLFLNVYTPTLDPDSPLAVLVFIHGGGFLSGSGNVDNYGPDFLVRKGVVVVTINYRLDALGFLSLDTEEVPGNAGLKDQVAALEWVQNNIGVFGGDPKNVTIMGQSAGSASVAYHILSPRSKGLFLRAISMSGTPYNDFAFSYQPRKRAFFLGKLLGNDTTDDVELLNYLQSVDAVKLVGTLSAVLASEPIINNFVKLFSFVPVVEKCNSTDSFLTEDPSVLLSEGRINNVDLMFGYTNEETATAISVLVDYLLERYNRYAEILVPTKILFHSTPNTILEVSNKIMDYYFQNTTINVDNMPTFISYMNNASFVYDIQRFYGQFPKLENNSMFFYKFSSVSSRNVYAQLGAEYGVVGAGHLDDLMYMFDAKSMNMTIDMNSTEFALIDQATTVFTNFVKYGNPTPDSLLGVSWPQYNNETLCYVDIGSNLTTSCAPDQDDVAFWKSIFEYVGLPY